MAIRMSLWWKLTGSMAGLVVLVMTAVLITVSGLVERRIRNDINQNFEETGRIFERIQEIRFRLLYQTAILLTDLPIVKGAISTGDQQTVTQLIQNDLQPLLDFDPVLSDAVLQSGDFSHPDSLGLLLILDKNGYPLGQLSQGTLPRHSLADRAGITEALNGEYPDQFYIWEQDGRYFNVITVPVWLGYDLLGTLSFGYPIRQAEAEQLSRDTGLEVLYFVQNRILTNTLSFDPVSREAWTRDLFAATYEVVRTGEAIRTQLQTSEGAWIIYLASMLPADNAGSGISGYYVVARSLDQALEPLAGLQRIIYIVGLLSVLLATILSALLASRINRPIELITQGIRRIESGEYNEPVPVVTRDELSVLTETFNHLVLNLRERLQMLKFVSKATLEAIQKNMSSVEPGGTRKAVTVFFSDIRGFTRWSEKRPPETVIEMLNTCLRLQADIVRECGGDVDKFVGDELVAVFEGDQKESRAVDAATRIQHAMSAQLADQPGIHIGIGINSGDVVMGAVGSRDRMDYTVIGNHVNLGARLCSAAEAGQILISGSVADRLERRILVNELDPIMAKGIENPVPVFEVNWKQLALAILIGFLIGSPRTSIAQINFGGLADFEIRDAESDSGPFVNNTPGKGTLIYTTSLRFFFDADAGSRLNISGALQTDYYGSTTLNPVFVSLLSATWQPWSSRDFVLLAGRLITPVGSYSERFLSSETPFRHAPLSHERFIGVDKIRGYSFSRPEGNYPGMTPIYNRMYTTGMGISGGLGDDQPFTYTLLATTSSPSGFFDSAPHGISGAMGRITWQPAIFMRIGVSGGWGPYMKPSVENNMLTRKALASYDQYLAGVDAEFSYHYSLLRIEYLWTRFNAPQIERSSPAWTGTANSTGAWTYVQNDIKADITLFTTELVQRIPAQAGLTFAARIDLMQERAGDLVRPQNFNLPMPMVNSPRYSNNHLSGEVGFSYSLSRQADIKVSRLITISDRNNLRDGSIGVALSVVF